MLYKLLGCYCLHSVCIPWRNCAIQPKTEWSRDRSVSYKLLNSAPDIDGYIYSRIPEERSSRKISRVSLFGSPWISVYMAMRAFIYEAICGAHIYIVTCVCAIFIPEKRRVVYIAGVLYVYLENLSQQLIRIFTHFAETSKC